MVNDKVIGSLSDNDILTFSVKFPVSNDKKESVIIYLFKLQEVLSVMRCPSVMQRNCCLFRLRYCGFLCSRSKPLSVPSPPLENKSLNLGFRIHSPDIHKACHSSLRDPWPSHSLPDL